MDTVWYGWVRDAEETRIIAECCFMYARINPQIEGKYPLRDRDGSTSSYFLSFSLFLVFIKIGIIRHRTFIQQSPHPPCVHFIDILAPRKSMITRITFLLFSHCRASKKSKGVFCRLSIFLANYTHDRASINKLLVVHKRFRIIATLRNKSSSVKRYAWREIHVVVDKFSVEKNKINCIIYMIKTLQLI